MVMTILWSTQREQTMNNENDSTTDVCADQAAEEKKTRFQLWYADNATKLAERRSTKYKEDPSHRQKLLDYNKAYRSKKLQERGPLVKQPLVMTIMIKGVNTVTRMIRISEFSQLINRSIQTIRSWEKKGSIPRTPFSSGGQRRDRLYTAEMVEVVKSALLIKGNNISAADKSFHDEILAGWKLLGINMGAV
jgi:hypothetical protein